MSQKRRLSCLQHYLQPCVKFVLSLSQQHIRPSLALSRHSCPALLCSGTSHGLHLRPASPCTPGSNASGFSAVPFSALPASSMLAVPSARIGVAPVGNHMMVLPFFLMRQCLTQPENSTSLISTSEEGFWSLMWGQWLQVRAVVV